MKLIEGLIIEGVGFDTCSNYFKDCTEVNRWRLTAANV